MRWLDIQAMRWLDIQSMCGFAIASDTYALPHLFCILIHSYYIIIFLRERDEPSQAKAHARAKALQDEKARAGASAGSRRPGAGEVLAGVMKAAANASIPHGRKAGEISCRMKYGLTNGRT